MLACKYTMGTTGMPGRHKRSHIYTFPLNVVNALNAHSHTHTYVDLPVLHPSPLPPPPQTICAVYGNHFGVYNGGGRHSSAMLRVCPLGRRTHPCQSLGRAADEFKIKRKCLPERHAVLSDARLCPINTIESLFLNGTTTPLSCATISISQMTGFSRIRVPCIMSARSCAICLVCVLERCVCVCVSARAPVQPVYYS